jgi:hypothetical protein
VLERWNLQESTTLLFEQVNKALLCLLIGALLVAMAIGVVLSLTVVRIIAIRYSPNHAEPAEGM